MSDDRGQAVVEALWMIPVAIGAALCFVAMAGALVAESTADGAAEAAAIASLQGADPDAAARRAAGTLGLAGFAVTSQRGFVRVDISAGALPGRFDDLVRARSSIDISGVEQ